MASIFRAWPLASASLGVAAPSITYLSQSLGRFNLRIRAYREPVSLVMILGDSERALGPMLPDTA